MTFGRGTLKFQWYASYLLIYKKNMIQPQIQLEKKIDLNCFPALQKSHQINQDHANSQTKTSGASRYREVRFLAPKSLYNPGGSVLFGGDPQGLSFLNTWCFVVGVSYPPGKIPIFLNESEIWPSLIFLEKKHRLLQLGQSEKFKWNHWHAQLKFLGSHREIPGYTRKHIGGTRSSKTKVIQSPKYAGQIPTFPQAKNEEIFETTT